MDEVLCSRHEQCLIQDKRHVLTLGGNKLTLPNPKVMLHDTKGAELSHILYLVELKLGVFLRHLLLNLVS